MLPSNRHIHIVLTQFAIVGCLFSGCTTETRPPIDVTDSSSDSEHNDVEEDSTNTCQIAALPKTPSPPFPDVEWTINRQTTLDTHSFSPTAEDISSLGYGASAMLFDANDDTLIDILLQRRHPDGTPTCLYLNTSSQTDISFEKTTCFPGLERGAGGRLIPTNAETRKVFVLSGNSVSQLTHKDGEYHLQPLANRDTTQTSCYFSSVLPHPSDPDKIVVFTHAPTDSADPDINSCQPRVLPLSDITSGLSPWTGLENSMVLLAATYIDVTGDGSLNLALAVDSYSAANNRNTIRNPGGFLGESSPHIFSLKPWLNGNIRAWGSYMGIGQMTIDSDRFTVLGDLGAPMIREVTRDVRISRLIHESLSDDSKPRFSWSPIVADFNIDGLQDLLLTRGRVPASDSVETEEADILLMQTAEGFDNITSSSGLLAHPPAYGPEQDGLHSSRAGTVTDFDQDGRLDLFILPFEGRPLLYEASTPTHCLVRVHSDYIRPAFIRYGWSTVGHDGTIKPAQTDGHMRLSEPLWFPVPAGKGLLQSPTGARIPYTCEPGDRLDISEPQWLETKNGEVTINACKANRDNPLIQIQKHGEEGVSRVLGNGNGTYSFPVPTEGTTTIYLDGKYSITCNSNGQCQRDL